MICPLLLAASVSFSASTTGLEKGALVEFAFVGKNSDRDYESLFVLDEPMDDLCRRLEKAGLPRGKPEDADACRLWPVGVTLSFKPALDDFLTFKSIEGLPFGKPIYTGGTRKGDGSCAAGDTMPAAFFSTYSLAQAPIVFDGIYNQGAIYGAITAKDTMKKGERITFTLSWETNSLPRAMKLVARPGESVRLLEEIRTAAEKSALDLTVAFDAGLSLREATAVSLALATLDSPRIKVNGRDNVFYRSFLPLVKWRDRKERLTQPFELSIGQTNRLVHISEDWSGDAIDPKLSPVEISFADAVRYPKTDTCFIYAESETTVGTICKAMNQLSSVKIKNWYVFEGQ